MTPDAIRAAREGADAMIAMAKDHYGKDSRLGQRMEAERDRRWPLPVKPRVKRDPSGSRCWWRLSTTVTGTHWLAECDEQGVLTFCSPRRETNEARARLLLDLIANPTEPA